MKQLSRFKVIKNVLVCGDYEILVCPSRNDFGINYLKYTVSYKDKEIFSSNEKDTLEDIIEVIFELEKDDQDFKDRKTFQLCLEKIVEKSK